jgi:hypothetical protein
MSAALQELLSRHADMLARRESLVAEIRTLDFDATAVVHVIGLLDPARAVPAAPSRRTSGFGRRKDRPSKPDAYGLFESGKITHAMLETLREATAPMDVGSVTKGMLAAKGVDPETVVLGHLSRRISTNLQKLANRGRLKKHEDADGMRWEVAR